MSRSVILLLCLGLSIPLLFASQQKSALATAKAKTDYELAAKRMAQSVKYVGQPLRSLTKEQKASVATLLVMSRIVGQNEVARSTSGLSLSDSFWTEVSGICPAPNRFSFTRGGCMDEEIAYAEAMAKCTDSKKTESQCDKETSGEMTAAVNCKMKQLEDLPGIIGGIPGRQWPSTPFPWPETGPLSNR